ncbi:MAG: hypothetical protein JRE23_18460, partial [Deltaproteobacteria bacterium]|nr:hypothetical protein [Deltaproteobacteria bacterium]
WKIRPKKAGNQKRLQPKPSSKKITLVIKNDDKGDSKMITKGVPKMVNTKETITKEKKETITKETIQAYCDLFKIRYGKYPTITGKDSGIVKRLKNVPDIKLLLERYFQSRDAFIIKNAHSLAIFETKINQLIVQDKGNFSGISEWTPTEARDEKRR